MRLWTAKEGSGGWIKIAEPSWKGSLCGEQPRSQLERKQHILNQRGCTRKDPGNEGKVASQENQEPDRINLGQKQSKIIK